MVNHLYALEKIIAKDIDYIEKSLHKDFLSVQEYEMVSREEFLQQMKEEQIFFSKIMTEILRM